MYWGSLIYNNLYTKMIVACANMQYCTMSRVQLYREREMRRKHRKTTLYHAKQVPSRSRTIVPWLPSYSCIQTKDEMARYAVLDGLHAARDSRSSPHSGLRSVSTVLSSPGYRTSVDEVKLVPNNMLLENLHEPERNRTREARTGPERTGPEDKSRSHPWEDRSQPRARRPRPRLKPRPRAP